MSEWTLCSAEKSSRATKVELERCSNTHFAAGSSKRRTFSLFSPSERHRLPIPPRWCMLEG
jgi:hypothetical protein